MGNCPIFCKKSIICATLFGCWAWFLKGPLWPDVREMCLLNGVYYSEIGPFGPEYTPWGEVWAERSSVVGIDPASHHLIRAVTRLRLPPRAPDLRESALCWPDPVH